MSAVRVVLAAALLPGCAYTLGRADVQYAADLAVLPLVQPSTDTRRWYVPLHSDTAGDYLLFVDTGYTYTTCDDDFVAALGLTTRGRGSVRVGLLLDTDHHFMQPARGLMVEGTQLVLHALDAPPPLGDARYACGSFVALRD